MGDTQRPRGGGDGGGGGGYRPRLLLSQRRTRRDGRDRRTCYSACNSGASEGGDAANGDVAYESASDSRVGLRDIFDEMRVGGFIVLSSWVVGGGVLDQAARKRHPPPCECRGDR